ncbi:hypothetical protein NLI96_g6211 [Meripilus lineatus]|uniref:Uncharacterized protein n=1 Tax=Meripilus lineatus TaxID=2056292 RepID=A0AAD5V1B0_9APHY|nr:hypothetical protein NLI96_g6211 [Physisporinus lineatus]
MDQIYGRNRQSIADLEQVLYTIFTEHPLSKTNDKDEPVIPGDALVDVLRTFSSRSDSGDLLAQEEEDQLSSLLKSNPGLEVTPQILLQFIAAKTTSPKRSPEHSPPMSFSELSDRGRDDQQPPAHSHSRSHSRSSSAGSSGTSVYHPSSRPPSRPPSRGPPVPKTPQSADSPFDRRQRTTPLSGAAAPSSWSRRPPPSRRRSDAGSHSRTFSDSESSVSSPPPISFSNSYGGRARTPSNPPSPSRDHFSASGYTSRPHSRAQSQPQSAFGEYARSDEGDYPASPPSEPDFEHTIQSRTGFTGLMSPPPSSVSDTSLDYDDDATYAARISALPLIRPHSPSDHSDADSSDDDMERGRVLDHRASMASMMSTISMEDQEKMETLEKSNKELARKLMEAERTLSVRMADHENDLADMEAKIEEMRSELSATKREEKDLRGREASCLFFLQRALQNQISGAEAEIAKLQKQLDNSKQIYQNLQKQYAEQLAESERTRSQLRARNDDLKHAKENLDLQSLELQKWASIQVNYDAQLQSLQEELQAAQMTNAELDEQKQENLMLKETIDRMRYEMDEMRNNIAGVASGGTVSAKGSVSRTLGMELGNRLKDMEWEDRDDDERVKELLEEESEEEDEDVIQTVITRTKRRIGGRTKKNDLVNFSETKDYVEEGIQADPIEGTSVSTQTDPPPKILTASSSMQTDPPPLTVAADIQTDPIPEPTPPPLPETCSVEVQTDEIEEEVSEPEPEPEPEASTSTASVGISTSIDEELDSLASSSSTILPPTPKSEHQPHTHEHHDLPPAYDQASEDLALRIANETLKTWHKGTKFPFQPIEGGISEEVIEDWKALKEELGVECVAIDKLIEESGISPKPRAATATAKHRRSRFYNIYNTYVYGDRSSSSSTASHHSFGQLLFAVGASAAVAFLVGHAMAPPYAVPGGATYYDRAAWESFNSVRMGGEGFAGDGGAAAGAALWGFIGRIGGGAARTLRGWPT